MQLLRSGRPHPCPSCCCYMQQLCNVPRARLLFSPNVLCLSSEVMQQHHVRFGLCCDAQLVADTDDVRNNSRAGSCEQGSFDVPPPQMRCCNTTLFPPAPSVVQISCSYRPHAQQSSTELTARTISSTPRLANMTPMLNSLRTLALLCLASTCCCQVCTCAQRATVSIAGSFIRPAAQLALLLQLAQLYPYHNLCCYAQPHADAGCMHMRAVCYGLNRP